MRVFTSLDEIRAAQGSVLGTSDWLTIDQERIDRFADATGDHQWIHVDQERATQGPFGATIAHGYLTLSLLPYFSVQNYRVEGARMSVNYGLDKVRFVAPVKVGSRLRGVTELAQVTDVDGGAQLRFRTTVELDGSERPACVAETLSRQYF
ncbi:MaoC family dehydratase [Yinghuangia sp. ASG 101]|uniref:MaoC family dehydratase n=1 Tax=Yinghuangia sp. ASG 101 TaxID=2896848 RepID=UPI001E62493A|nr:MaoC family dehydratase [Yinghuangia sp. ASG 101]UGQ11217.1 MaoC family dehydratase [Yinghuangia sp. ASG 101]